MKIHDTTPKILIRICISRKNDDTVYMTLCECTAKEVEVFIKKTISGRVNLFPDGYATRIDIREATGSKNGKSQSFRCYGISPKEIIGLITKKLNNEKE